MLHQVAAAAAGLIGSANAVSRHSAESSAVSLGLIGESSASASHFHSAASEAIGLIGGSSAAFSQGRFVTGQAIGLIGEAESLAVTEIAPASVIDVENSMRVAAWNWSVANGLPFEFDNSTDASVTDPTQSMMVWAYSETNRQRLSGLLVEVKGQCRGTILVPATPANGSSYPMQEHMAQVESLLEEFRGRNFGRGKVTEQSRVSVDGSVGSMRAITAVIEWELIIKQPLPGTIVTTTAAGGAQQAYEVFRSIWGESVAPSITTKSYFDVPPGLALELPASVCSYSVLRSSALEMDSSLGLGRVEVDIHYLLGTGVQAIQEDSDLIVNSFDSVGSDKVVFQTPTVTRLGRTSEETWHVNVRMPFTFKDNF
jgi:hypothetical protein